MGPFFIDTFSESLVLILEFLELLVGLGAVAAAPGHGCQAVNLKIYIFMSMKCKNLQLVMIKKISENKACTKAFVKYF